MLPASAVEQSFKEMYLQGQQTAESGETERSRAGAEASANECAPGSPEASTITAVVHYLYRQTFFSLHRNPIYDTHYNPGVAELQRNPSLMRLLRSSTRAARASAVRFFFFSQDHAGSSNPASTDPQSAKADVDISEAASAGTNSGTSPSH